MSKFKNLDALAKRMKALQGKSVVVGVLASHAGDKEEGSDITLLEKAVIHEFGAPIQGIPERSFLRSTFSKGKDSAAKIIGIDARSYLSSGGDPNTPLINAGRYLEGKTKDKIDSGKFTPLSKSTIRAKKSSKPLIDTGQLVQGITYEVRDES